VYGGGYAKCLRIYFWMRKNMFGLFLVVRDGYGEKIFVLGGVEP